MSKADVQNDINGLLSNVLGMNPEDLLSDEEIEAHLREAFNKFDKDRSGQLGAWEFQQAWFYLGLKGTESEIKDAYSNGVSFVSLNLVFSCRPTLRVIFIDLSCLQIMGGIQMDLGVALLGKFKNAFSPCNMNPRISLEILKDF